MKYYLPRQLLLMLLLFLPVTGKAAGQTPQPQPVVRAVLFYSPTCPHCHFVIDEVLPSLMEKYGEGLDILMIGIQSPQGENLYWAMVDQFQVPPERQGVPTLVAGQQVLVGGGEIPELFPGMIEKGLADGGIPWPSIPGLHDVLEEAGSWATETAQALSPSQQTLTVTPESLPTQSPTTAAVTSLPSCQPFLTTPELTPDGEGKTGPFGSNGPTGKRAVLEKVIKNLERDPLGHALSILILIGMMASVIGVAWGEGQSTIKARSWTDGWIPLLSILGIAVAGYLSYIELSNRLAICGPVGDCNRVQQSPYATIGGVLPVGLLGLLGYIGIIVAWVLYRTGPSPSQRWAALFLYLMTWAGTLFSIYLTFLEPFVIGATCAWCLTSAVVITLQLWLAAGMMERVGKPWQRDRGQGH